MARTKCRVEVITGLASMSSTVLEISNRDGFPREHPEVFSKFFDGCRLVGSYPSHANHNPTHGPFK